MLGLAVRENLGFQDIWFLNDKPHQIKIVERLRKYQPEIVLANSMSDRHPDHGRGAQVVADAIFYVWPAYAENQ